MESRGFLGGWGLLAGAAITGARTLTSAEAATAAGVGGLEEEGSRRKTRRMTATTPASASFAFGCIRTTNMAPVGVAGGGRWWRVPGAALAVRRPDQATRRWRAVAAK